MQKDLFSIGLDFGTESGRALLVDIATGEERASSVHHYEHGVIEKRLPDSDISLEPETALQHPADYLSVLRNAIPAVLRQANVTPDQVIGIGVDFTSCTILPTLADGTPLCELPEWRDHPHAWTKLWKHHAAQPEADSITKTATEANEKWLARYGGKVSSEWLHSKSLQILNDDPQLFAAADHILEAGDWIVWQLTGVHHRNACAAGYKALWNGTDGYPSDEFLQKLHPQFSELNKKLAAPILAPGRLAGRLTAQAAALTGLKQGTPVAMATIDAHAAVAGAGVASAGELVMVLGTSSCHMLLHNSEVLVPGISGVVQEGILPGFYGYEAGQAGVGDSFDWLMKNLAGDRAKFNDLGSAAASLRAGASGLLALDWWNGNRCTLNDASLSGMFIGLTCASTLPEIYRAMMEATGFGLRVIVEQFESHGVPIKRLVACGGIAEKNKTLLQIYADILKRPIHVAKSKLSSALGAAILGANAAAEANGEEDSLLTIVSRMASPGHEHYEPKQEQSKVYDALYAEYCKLYEYFGTTNSVMHHLREIANSGAATKRTVTMHYAA